jgi:hypothetical protein
LKREDYNWEFLQRAWLKYRTCLKIAQESRRCL